MVATTTKITTGVRILKKALSFVGGAILANPIVPVMENVLFEVEEGTMRMTGSDLNTTLITSVSVESDEDVRFCVAYKTLSDLLGSLPEQPIELVIGEDNSITLVTDSGRYDLMGDDPSLYIEHKVKEENAQLFELNAQERALFAGSITQILYAASTNDLKTNLVGVCWESTDFCTHDGIQKLARVSNLPVKVSSDGTQYLIPAKVASLLSKLSDSIDPDKPLSINLTSRNVLFSIDGSSIICTLIDSVSKFPPYQLVYPTSFAITWQADRQTMLASLRRALILSNQASSAVRLEGSTKGTITITVKELDLSQAATERVSADVDGDLSIAFQGKYLLESLKNLTGDTVTMHLNSVGQVMMLTGDNENVSQLLFPIQLEW